jgi:flavin reductase (DIM6/NTAB) family NADH-FMN oxidoreductase RutF
MTDGRSDGGAGGPGPDAGADAYDRLRRRVLWALPTGLFVVGSRAGDDRNLMTCNWVMQVATAPKLVAVAVESDSVTRGLIERGGSFSVSLLARSERGLVRRFVKPVRDITTDARGVALRMQGEPVHEVADGLPCLDAAVAWLACSVRSLSDWGDLPPERGVTVGTSAASHVLVVGEVVAAAASDRLGGDSDDNAVLSMSDTRMNYGG